MNVVLVGRVERENAAAALGQFERFTTLDCLLTPHLIFVILGKIADDDRDWQSDDEDTTDAASGANQLITPAQRNIISLTNTLH